MNYSKIYDQLIQNAVARNSKRALGYQRHHIIPRSFGGSDDASNLVYLTFKEHALAHILLYKMCRDDSEKRMKMLNALRIMRGAGTARLIGRLYEKMLEDYSYNHPAKTDKVRDKIRNTLLEYRLNNGWSQVKCSCGCDLYTDIVSISDGKNVYIQGHEPVYECLCGCGQFLTTKNSRIEGHESKCYTCYCGCQESTSIPFNIKYPHKKCFIPQHDTGRYERVSQTLSETLKKYDGDTMANRMKKSALKCDQEKRAEEIKKGKASVIEVIDHDGTRVRMFSYQTIEFLGLSWPKIKYIMKAHKGLIADGRRVIMIEKYTGGNKWKKK